MQSRGSQTEYNMLDTVLPSECGTQPFSGGATSIYNLIPSLRTTSTKKQRPFSPNCMEKKVKERLPIRIQWILHYIDAKRVIPNNLLMVDLDDLLAVVMLLLTFFTMSRPNELLLTDKSEFEIILTGLTLADIQWTEQYCQLSINHYKNQVSRLEPKVITLAPPTCGKTHCKCHRLNFFRLLQIYLIRRRNFLSTNEFNRLPMNKQRNLHLNGNSFLFVNTKGKVMQPPDLSSIVEDLKALVKCPEPNRISSYSLRIGGCTLAAGQGLAHLKILHYVSWAIPRLPHGASTRYFKHYTPQDLMMMPFEMIHGKDGHRDLSNTDLPVINIWHSDMAKNLMSI
eukprot:47783_1